MKAFLNWSGGKDAALSLYKARQEGLPVDGLLTTFSGATNRVTMHGVRRHLVKLQALSLGLPLHSVDLPELPNLQAYEESLHAVHRQLKSEGYTHALFGDVFLEDLKQYRETLLAKEGLHGVFPLWKMDSREAIQQFLDAGFQAIVVCVNGALLDKSFCGRLLDASFLADLPAGVDPCGENGEYHSFVFDGPLFSRPVNFEVGELVYQEYPSPRSSDCFTAPQPVTGFYFCDLLPL